VLSEYRVGKLACGDIAFFESGRPWNDVSRFSDEEMKKLMIDVVNHCYNFLLLLFNDSKGDEIIELLKEKDVKPEWQDPIGIP
jgi:hypothetical protein